jgi:uncharacterized protein (DUF433 family)
VATQTPPDAELIARYIELNPHKPGEANARLAEFGVAVWALVAYWQSVNRDTAQVARDYRLPVEAVEAALAYYRTHQTVIDARLAVNAS